MAEEKNFSGFIFGGSKFIGSGLGFFFGRPEVGGAVGMGIGFLARVLFRIKRQSLRFLIVTTTRSFFRRFLDSRMAKPGLFSRNNLSLLNRFFLAFIGQILRENKIGRA